MHSNQCTEICSGVNFTYIPSTKFKTTQLSFTMFVPLDKNEASKNAIIPNLLAHSCKAYPTLMQISKCLEELYGAKIATGVGKFGDNQVITLSAACINNNFTLDGNSVILELTQLLCNMIFEPDTDEQSFKKEHLEQERRQLIESIEAEFNDKKVYAHRRCEGLMCEKEKFGINRFGTVEDVKKLTGENIFEAWQILLKTARIELILTGSAACDPVISEFKNRFAKIQRNNIVKCTTNVINKAETVRDFNDEMNVTQCKLVMGLRTGAASPDYKSTTPMQVMNTLFGGSAQSKLFMNVREKLSLCYYCGSSYNKQNGIIFIQSGVEQKNIEKAKKEIMEQLKEVKIGNFSNRELDETKLYLTQSIEKTKDSPGALDAWYTAQALLEKKKSPDELINEIKEVTREQVIAAANKVTLDTVYTLIGKEAK